ncbi:MAG: hypothetical protein KDK48_04235 [Chlamydiia bacterium]|nr:hypothetical protein [Chlamydiia bacterium]
MPEQKTQIPYSWLRELDPDVSRLDTVPLFGRAPEFPWEAFSELLAQRFQCDTLSVSCGEVLWRAENELYQDFGENPLIFEIGFAGLEGSVFFVLKRTDFDKIVAKLAGDLPPEGLAVFNDGIKEAFETFVFAEVLYCIDKIPFDKTLSPHPLKTSEPPQVPCLSVHVHLQFGADHLSGRLLLHPDFLTAWRKKFEEHDLHLSVNKELLSELRYTFGMEVGKTVCAKADFSTLKAGDILILDYAGVDPEAKTGEVSLTLKGKHKFSGKLSQKSLKITAPPALSEGLKQLKKAKQSTSKVSEVENA